MAQAIYDAGAEYGCFQLVNHGVSLDLIARMQAAQRDFFALPLETKAKGVCVCGWVDGWVGKRADACRSAWHPFLQMHCQRRH